MNDYMGKELCEKLSNRTNRNDGNVECDYGLSVTAVTVENTLAKYKSHFSRGKIELNAANRKITTPVANKKIKKTPD